MSQNLTTYSSRLYKADQRNSSLNQSSKQQAVLTEEGFGPLAYFNDMLLRPGQHISHAHAPGVLELVLPLAGSVVYHDAEITDECISSEEVLLLHDASGSYTLQNPYEEEPVNYLHIGLACPAGQGPGVSCSLIPFKTFNRLVSPELNGAPAGLHLAAGVYSGRAKDGYQLKDATGGAFVFVINGAFEVEDRLMEHRDGLALWNLAEINFEALSESAILLVMELPAALNPKY